MPIEKWRELNARVKRMKKGEILDRSRQALATRCDAALGWMGYDFARNSRSLKPTSPGSFFFVPESVDPILALLKQRLPARAEQIIQEADQICEHRFDLLGYSGLYYGSSLGWDIDWHLDAVHGKRAPRKPFYRIRYLDYAECGDSKVIWELNRHQHLVTLAKAYRLGNDRRYADEILRQRRHWQAENPYPTGINWASSLEVAFRSLSWLWTYYLLRGAPGIPELREEWLRGLAVHGRHIERYLSTHFSPNTHLLGEGVALFFLGVLCPELRAGERWKSLGWQIVLSESERQVRNDGFHFEQSTYYHVYALDLFLHAAVMAAINNIPAPRTFEDRIEKMLTVLCLLGRSGPPPRFGDDDGGRLFDPRRNRSEHLLDPLATGAILFHRGDFKSVAGSLREETLWLLGVKGVEQWDQLEEAEVGQESTALPEAGYYVLSGSKTQLLADAGALGAQSGGHGHADALSVCLQSRGHSLLIDPGTFEYVGAGGDRDLFRGTAMHNTLCVDGKSQAETTTVFSWRRLTQSQVERWVQGHGFDLLVANHDGYKRLEPPVTHQRWVVSLKNEVYLVRDVVGGSGKHRIDIAWHLGRDLEQTHDCVFRVRGESYGLAFFPAQKDWSMETRQDCWSPAYGQKVPATVLNFGVEAPLPMEFGVLLMTSEDVDRNTGSFRHIERTPDSNITRYEYAAEGSRYSFYFSDCGEAWRTGLLGSDARYVCHEQGLAAKEHLMFCDGSYVAIDGSTELRASRQIAWAELFIDDAGRKLFSSDKSAILDKTAAKLASDTASTISE